MRFHVPIKNILGLNYYRYELTTTNYNPPIDNNITITCKVTNVFNNPVPDKELTLYDNGVSVGNSTTNSSGVATWTVTLSDWNVHHFNVSNATLDIRATGWKEVWRNTTSNPKIQVFRNADHCRLKLTAYTVSSMNTTWTQYGSTAFLSDWKPSQAVAFIGYDYTFLLRVGDDGKLYWRTVSDSLSNKNLYGQYEWSIE